mmetsp:Transcript_3876/g.14293  ORF Transcript_3876/g.14293 Transcript_3876/m.14293 type:complete len:207 (+) Transcript_3876:2368-2988(+)
MELELPEEVGASVLISKSKTRHCSANTCTAAKYEARLVLSRESAQLYRNNPRWYACVCLAFSRNGFSFSFVFSSAPASSVFLEVSESIGRRECAPPLDPFEPPTGLPPPCSATAPQTPTATPASTKEPRNTFQSPSTVFDSPNCLMFPCQSKFKTVTPDNPARRRTPRTASWKCSDSKTSGFPGAHRSKLTQVTGNPSFGVASSGR